MAQKTFNIYYNEFKKDLIDFFNKYPIPVPVKYDYMKSFLDGVVKQTIDEELKKDINAYNEELENERRIQEDHSKEERESYLPSVQHRSESGSSDS